MIVCLSENVLGHEKEGYRCSDTIIQPTSLNYDLTVMIERLRSYIVHLESSPRTKTMILGAIFGKLQS